MLLPREALLDDHFPGGDIGRRGFRLNFLLVRDLVLVLRARRDGDGEQKSGQNAQ